MRQNEFLSDCLLPPPTPTFTTNHSNTPSPVPTLIPTAYHLMSCLPLPPSHDIIATTYLIACHPYRLPPTLLTTTATPTFHLLLLPLLPTYHLLLPLPTSYCYPYLPPAPYYFATHLTLITDYLHYGFPQACPLASQRSRKVWERLPLQIGMTGASTRTRRRNLWMWLLAGKMFCFCSVTIASSNRVVAGDGWALEKGAAGPYKHLATKVQGHTGTEPQRHKARSAQATKAQGHQGTGS